MKGGYLKCVAVGVETHCGENGANVWIFVDFAVVLRVVVGGIATVVVGLPFRETRGQSVVAAVRSQRRRHHL